MSDTPGSNSEYTAADRLDQSIDADIPDDAGIPDPSDIPEDANEFEAVSPDDSTIAFPGDPTFSSEADEADVQEQRQDAVPNDVEAETELRDAVPDDPEVEEQLRDAIPDDPEVLEELREEFPDEPEIVEPGPEGSAADGSAVADSVADELVAEDPDAGLADIEGAPRDVALEEREQEPGQ